MKYMRKALLTFLAASLLLCAEDYNHYSVAGALGSSLKRRPFDPQFNIAASGGYRFTNHPRFADTVYIGSSYTHGSSDLAIGLKRTFTRAERPIGLFAISEAGGVRLANTGVVKRFGAVGMGTVIRTPVRGMTLFMLSKINKAEQHPWSVSLRFGVGKSF